MNVSQRILASASHFVAAAFLATAFPAMLLASTSTTVGINTLSVEQLASLIPGLRTGGYVIYLRHAETLKDREDRHPVDLQDCNTQRPLSDRGRQQAENIGRSIKRLGIPIGRVLTSPFCRAIETAQLAFGRHEVSDDLYFALRLTENERKAKGAWLRNALSSRPHPGTNSVIVAHTANLDEAVGIWPKPEGVALIFLPDGQGGTQAIGRVAPETWQTVRAGKR